MKRLALLCVMSVVIGCGAQTYRSRLERTSKYYRYLEKLDANLSTNRWKVDGISLRVPKQFEIIPFRVPTKGESASKPETLPVVFPRGIGTLEGMLGRWYTMVDVGGRDEKLPAFMFVTSNQFRWTKDGMTRETAAKYEVEMIQQVYNATTGERMPPKNEWKEKQFPESGGYSDRIPFSAFKIGPIASVIGLEGDYEFLLYTHSAASIQVAVLFVIPTKTVSNARLSEKERIGMCLETMKIAGSSQASGSSRGSGSQNVPRRKAPGGGLDF